MPKQPVVSVQFSPIVVGFSMSSVISESAPPWRRPRGHDRGIVRSVYMESHRDEVEPSKAKSIGYASYCHQIMTDYAKGIMLAMPWCESEDYRIKLHQFFKEREGSKPKRLADRSEAVQKALVDLRRFIGKETRTIRFEEGSLGLRVTTSNGEVVGFAVHVHNSTGYVPIRHLGVGNLDKLSHIHI